MVSLRGRWSLDRQTGLELWGRTTLHILPKVGLCFEFCLQSGWSQFNGLLLCPVQLRLRKYSRYSVSRYSKYPVNRYRGSAQPEEFPIGDWVEGSVPCPEWGAAWLPLPPCWGCVCPHVHVSDPCVHWGPDLVALNASQPVLTFPLAWRAVPAPSHTVQQSKAKQSQAHFVALNFYGGEDIKKWYSHVCLSHACY